MRDILKLYLTRNFVLAILILPFLVIGSVPFLPTAAAFYAFVSVSIVAFMMVIWAKPRDQKGPVLPGVIRFAIPSAIMLALFGLLVYAVFYFLSSPELFIHIDYTALEEAVFRKIAWDEHITENITGLENWYELYPSFEKAVQEVNARNAMLLFLTMAGVMQIFFISPPARFFSVDGHVTKDLRPAVLGILLLALIFVAYGQESLLYALSMVPLGDYKPIVYGMVFAWFLVARTVIRKGRLNKVTDMTVRLFERATDDDDGGEKRKRGRRA